MSDKKPICFVTNVYDSHYYSLGTSRLIKSAKYFHPEIPFFVLGTDWIEKTGGGMTGTWIPKTLLEYIEDYTWVCRIDADSIITGPLHELMDAITTDKYDVITVRNNNDLNKAGKDEALVQPGRDKDNYANAGFVATRSPQFVAEWALHNKLYADMLPFSEQTTLNALIQSFPTLIIDPPEADVHYGVSGLFGDEKEEETHWDSWKEIVVVNGELYLKGKKVKIVHNAGGKMNYKLGMHLFSDQSRKRICEISD